MSDTWFIGDTHFGHANILKYEFVARPFATLEEMHEVMIERWNSVVKKGDKVFHLGDVAFGANNLQILNRLNGGKRLILGNHDRYNTAIYLDYFHIVHGVLFWNNCVLTHVPVHPNQLEHRSEFNIHGHLHSKYVECESSDGSVFIPDKRYINVSCEHNNLTPINADIILQRIKNAAEV